MQLEPKMGNNDEASIGIEPACFCGDNCLLGCAFTCTGPCSGSCGVFCGNCGSACHTGNICNNLSGTH